MFLRGKQAQVELVPAALLLPPLGITTLPASSLKVPVLLHLRTAAAMSRGTRDTAHWGNAREDVRREGQKGRQLHTLPRPPLCQQQGAPGARLAGSGLG